MQHTRACKQYRPVRKKAPPSTPKRNVDSAERNAKARTGHQRACRPTLRSGGRGGVDFRTWMRSCNRVCFARSRGARLRAWESVARGRESGTRFVASFAGSVAFVDRAVTATWRCLSRGFSHSPVCSGVCERVHDLRMSWWRWRMCSRVCLRSVSSPVFLQPSWSAGRLTSRARLPASQ